MVWSKRIPEHPVVAVAGATGAVGAELLQVLSDRDFPAREVRALASPRSAGKSLAFGGCGDVPAGDLTVRAMDADAFDGVDIALFSAGASVSRSMRSAVVAAGAVMIDNSSAFRMDDDVPLIVPEVNPDDLGRHAGVIANPNCSTIQLVVALHALAPVAKPRRVVVSTYQAASGAGAAAMRELYDQTRDYLEGRPLEPRAFSDQIAFNVIPHIDVFLEDGSTKEEWKMVVETKKILGAPDLGVAANCARVPVLRCHAEYVNVEFATPITADEARAAFAQAPGVALMDDPASNGYPMPGLLAGTDAVHVGRVRADASVEHGISFWCVEDQIRKGAALNAVQIAELLLGADKACERLRGQAR